MPKFKALVEVIVDTTDISQATQGVQQKFIYDQPNWTTRIDSRRLVRVEELSKPVKDSDDDEN